MAERRNRWVMTSDEVRAVERRYSDPKGSPFVACSVQVFYETDPDAAAEVLPPPLQPANAPEVWVSVGHMPEIDLGVAQVAVRCRHGDEDGWYCLHLPMTTEAAVIGGRERYGENKKVADIRFEREGGHIEASVTRYGTTYLEVSADVAERLEPPEQEVVPHYYFKYSLAADGSGYDFEPLLIRSEHTRVPTVLERVEAKLVLRDSGTDPVADLPVERLGGSFYTERTATARARAVAQVDGEAFLPFVYQRYDYAGQG